MTVSVYVSCSQYAFLAPNAPASLLPRTEIWKYVGSADTSDLGLSDGDVNKLSHSGFGAREAEGRYSIR
jgi:hypothetical protein